MSVVQLSCLLLLLCTAVQGAPQRSVPRWTVRSSYSGTPGAYRGGSGTQLSTRGGFNRVGSGTRFTSLNTFSGGSTSGTNTFNGGNAFGSFFNEQFKNIQSSFSRESSLGSRGPSSFPSRTSSSLASRGSSSSSSSSSSEDSDD